MGDLVIVCLSACLAVAIISAACMVSAATKASIKSEGDERTKMLDAYGLTVRTLVESNHRLADKVMVFTEAGREHQRLQAEVSVLDAEAQAMRRIKMANDTARQPAAAFVNGDSTHAAQQRWADTEPE